MIPTICARALPAAAEGAEAEALRAHLRCGLPEYMVPAAFAMARLLALLAESTVA